MEKKRGPMPKDEQEKSTAVTVYAMRKILKILGKGDEKEGLKKARELAKAAIEKEGSVCQ